MTVTNNISGGTIGGPVIQSGGNVVIHHGTPASPRRTSTAATGQLRAQMDREGPRLALTTRGEAEALAIILARVAEEMPDFAATAVELRRRLLGRLAEHV
ncbi:hypothetical protein [Streptomyces sp. NPDC037389]|uniref:hypothetical protein n=1 Tax=Streptomyces sp. NPDC037389 TaxID=3155369 RepID=UPI0033EA1D78